MKLRCEGYYRIERNGVLFAEGKNLLTDQFLSAVIEGMINVGSPSSTARPWDFNAATISLCLGTANSPGPAVGNTDLVAELGTSPSTARVFAVTNDNPKQLRYVFEFTFVSGADVLVKEGGVKFTRVAAAVPATYLISRWLIPDMKLVSGDSAKVTWTLYFMRDFDD